jgi:fibronectin-binding autotransporter adhesin
LPEDEDTRPVSSYRNAPSRLLALAAILSAVAAAPKAQAQSYYWTGGFGDLWSSSFFWYGGTPGQSATTDLIFGQPIGGNSNFDNNGVVTNDIADNFYLRSLTFLGQAWSMGGKSLRFASGGSIFVQTSALVSNKISLDGTFTTFVNGGGGLTLTGIVSGGGSLLKDGDGTMALTGVNTYYGGTTVAKGRLVVSNPYGSYAVNGTSVLELATAGTQTLTDTVSGTGSLVKSGGGTLTLNTLNNTYSGGTTVNDGRLVVRKPLGSYVTNGSGTLEISPFEAVTLSTPITGTGSFAKGFVFPLTLSGNSTYQGSTTVDDGQLYLGIDNALPTSTALVLNGGQLYLNNHAQTVASLAGGGSAVLGSGSVLTVSGSTSTTFSGVLSSVGALKKQGTGTLTLSGVNTYSGGTTVNGGVLVESVPHGAYSVNGTGVLDIRTASTLTHATPITGTGTGSLIKSGAGVLTLTGQSTYGATTTVNAGTLANGINGALPASTALVVNVGGTYDLAGKVQTVASLSGVGSISSGGGTLTVGDATATTFSGVMSGAGSLTKVGTGTLTLSGANTYTGPTKVDAGRLIELKPHGEYVTNAALEFNVGTDEFNAPVPEFGGPISGSGSFTRTGIRTFRLTGTTTYTGGTILNGGYTIIYHPHGTYAISAGTLDFNVTDPYEQTMPITGSGGFDVTGSGTVTLSAVNTYTGLTTVFSGGLIDLHPHGSYKPLGGTLKLVNQTDINIGALQSGTGVLVKAGVGTLTMSSGATRAGMTTVDEGRLIDLAPGKNYVTNAELELGGASFPGTTSVSGTGNLTKSGTGTLNLATTDTYTGNTTVNAGRLITGSPHGTYVDNAALEFATGGSIAYGSTITGTGSLKLSGTGGMLTLSGINTYTGGTIMRGSSLTDLHPHGDYDTWAELFLSTASGATIGTVTGSISARLIKGGAGTLTVNAATGILYTQVDQGRLIELAPTGYDYRVGADLEFSVASDTSLTTKITGAGSFTKSGAGNLLLSYNFGQDNRITYGGSTTVAAGRLSIGKEDVLPTGTGLIVNGGATFDLNGFNQTVGSLAGGGSVLLGGKTLTVNGGGSTTFSGVTSGIGPLVKNGAGTLTLVGVNTYSGGTTVSGGRLVDQNPHGNYLDNATLEFAPAGTVSFAGSAITGTGAFVKGGAGTLTLTSALAATGSISIASGILKGSTLVFDRDIASTGGTLQFDQTSIGTFSRVFSGSGALLKTGAGTLTLSGANTYTGSTTISEGILRNGVTNALPTATNLTVGATYDLNGFSQTVGSVVGGGSVLLGTKTLTVNPGTDTLFSGVISGAGSLVKGGSGTMTLSGLNVYSGGTTVNTGRLIDRNPHGPYVTNAELEFRNAATYNQGLGAAITGTGSFTKSGGGNLVLLQPNSYAGATTLTEGTTFLSGGGSLPSSTALTVASGATFAFPFMSQTVASLTGAGTVDLSYGAALTVSGSADSSFGGSLTYDGRLIKNGTGKLTLTGSNNYTGSTFIYGGRLVVQNPNGAYFNSASLEFNTPTNRNFSDWIVGSGSFTKSGAGTLTLSGNASYGGGTTVSEGRLIDQNPHGDYLDNAALEFQGGGSQNHAGVISGTGSFTKSGGGTLSLGGINTYSGGTTVNAGRLIDANPHGSYVDNAALEFATATDRSLSGAVSGTGSLTKSGAGTLTLAGANAYTGGTAVNGGTLKVTGSVGGNLSVAAGATLDNATASGLTFGTANLQGAVRTANVSHFTGPVSGPGSFTGPGTVEFRGGYSPGNSPASVTFAGNMTLAATNSLTMELGGTTLGTGYDHLNVNGLATLGGSLTVAYYNGFSPSYGQSFDLFDFNSSSGMFASVSLPTLGNHLYWNTSMLYTDGSISVQAVPEPASFAALSLGALALLKRRKKSRS